MCVRMCVCVYVCVCVRGRERECVCVCYEPKETITCVRCTVLSDELHFKAGSVRKEALTYHIEL